jgi:hypothetical protein
MKQERMTTEQFRESGLQLRTSAKPVTDYKAEFMRQVCEAGLPEPETEFKFDEKRKWRFDWLFEKAVAVEYEGGVFSEGPSGHTSKSGVLRDIEKYNEATLAGYAVIRITPQSVMNGLALRYVKRALNLRNRAIIAPVEQAAKDAARTLRSVADKLEQA